MDEEKNSIFVSSAEEEENFSQNSFSRLSQPGSEIKSCSSNDEEEDEQELVKEIKVGTESLEIVQAFYAEEAEAEHCSLVLISDRLSTILEEDLNEEDQQERAQRAKLAKL